MQKYSQLEETRTFHKVPVKRDVIAVVLPVTLTVVIVMAATEKNVNIWREVKINVNVPERFDFSQPEGWERWIRRCERYRIASGLASNTNINQVSTFVYAMGEQAEDIIMARHIEETTFVTVKLGFDEY